MCGILDGRQISNSIARLISKYSLSLLHRTTSNRLNKPQRRESNPSSKALVIKNNLLDDLRNQGLNRVQR